MQSSAVAVKGSMHFDVETPPFIQNDLLRTIFFIENPLSISVKHCKKSEKSIFSFLRKLFTFLNFMKKFVKLTEIYSE